MTPPIPRSAPWTEIPPETETLFPELAPNGARPVQVTLKSFEETGTRVVMNVVAAQDNVGEALAMAARACRGLQDFEIRAGRFEV
jgi:hypothetical protein